MEELQGLSKEVNDEIVALGFQPIHKAIDQCYANIIAGKKGERFVFPTKWKKLNGLLLGGLQPGKMYVIAGRPGSGKSAFSNKMLFDMLEHPKNNGRLIVLYWSFEMPGYQQLMRIGSSNIGKKMSELLSVDTEFQDLHFEQFIKSMNPYKKYPIYFNNNAKDIAYVNKVTRRIASLNPDKIIINLFDHSRLFKKKKEESELQMLTDLSHTCIELQQDTKCITVLLSQLNRNIESNERAANLYQPMLSDLFGADSIGQDAHVVMIINRPYDMYDITVPYCGQNPKGLLAIHMEKNRDGELGMLPFNCDMSKFTIEER